MFKGRFLVQQALFAVFFVAAALMGGGCNGGGGGSNNASYAVTVVVSGLQGDLTVTLNGSESLAIAADGTYPFTTTLQNQQAYAVEVTQQPADQVCTSTASSGVVAAADVAVAFNCTTVVATVVEKPVVSHVWPSPVLAGYEVKVSGAHFDQAQLTYAGSVVLPSFQSPHEIRFVAPGSVPGADTLAIENSAGITSIDVQQGTPLSDVIAQSAGYAHSCVLTSTGEVRCWGSNINGELGYNTVQESSSPLTVAGVSNIVAIASGSSHNCALQATGAVLCWGYNASGQLGDGTTVSRSSVAPVVGISNAIAISLGGSYSCALLQDGTVQCWGAASVTGSSSGNRLTPATMTGLTAVTEISAGYRHACARQANGTLHCWGLNDYGQLGDGTNTNNLTPVEVAGISDAVAVSAGYHHSCALLQAGAVSCWGIHNSNGAATDTNLPAVLPGVTATAVTANAYDNLSCALVASGNAACWGAVGYSLGDSQTRESLTPVAVAGVNAASGIAGGSDYNCVLEAGSVRCWGSNANGRLGIPPLYNSLTPVTLGLVGSVSEISTSSSTGCALLASGHVQCWGHRLADYAGAPYSGPTTIEGLADTQALSLNQGSACAVAATGSVSCWGMNFYGQLGDGSFDNRVEPVAVNGISDAIDVSVGDDYSCAVRANGRVLCWGQLPGGAVPYPVEVEGITTAVSVSAATGHRCALLAAGDVYCWGHNSHGQLGNGTDDDSNTPVAVQGISNATAVVTASGVLSEGDFSCALLADGSVKCWGDGDNGQLGDGATVSSSTPVTVAGITDAVAIDADLHHACAVLRDGAVKCWGWNGEGWLPGCIHTRIGPDCTVEQLEGQLGDGTNVESATPVSVLAVDDAAASISVNELRNCVVMTNGEVQCWGVNNDLFLVPSSAHQPLMPVYQQ